MGEVGGRAGGWRLPASLGIIYVVWGSTYLAIRVMVRSIPPLLGSGARFTLAGLLLALVLRLRAGTTPWGVSARQVRGAAVAGILILVGGIGLVTVAEQHVPSAHTALVIASIPLWVVVLRLMHKERVRATTVGAVLLGFAGLVVLLRPGQDGGPQVASLALLVLAAILTAIGAFYSNKMEMPSNAFVATTIEMLVSGTALVLAGVAVGELRELSVESVSNESFGAFVYLVTIGSLVAYSAFVWLLGNARVSTVATYAYVNPVVAVILGVLILGERVSAPMAVGTAVIVLSVVLVVRSEQQDG